MGAFDVDTSPDKLKRRIAFLIGAFVVVWLLRGMSEFFYPSTELSVNVLGHIVRSLGTTVLDWSILVYFVTSTKTPWRDIGLRKVDAMTALFVFVGYVALDWLVRSVVREIPMIHDRVLAGHPYPWILRGSSYRAENWAEMALGVVWMVQVALKEELVFRGLITTGLLRVVKSPWTACFLSALCFSVGHLGQGLLPVLTIFPTAMYMAVVFWKTGSLWPLIAAHAVVNIAALASRSHMLPR